jgi:hypothetical protein
MTHGRWHRVWLWSEVPAAVDAWEAAQAGEFAGAFGDAGGGGREGTECDSVVELRGPYSSEVRSLEGVLRSLEKLPAVPLIAERGFDAVGLMQRVKELGCSVAIGVKETWGGARAEPAAAGVPARVEEVQSGAV